MAENEGKTENPERKGLKKGLYLLPSSFTAANVGMGFLSVLATLKGFQILAAGNETVWRDSSVYFDYAAKAIGLAILFDTLDGRIARMTKTTTEIGIQLDSFADVLTFGIAPIVLLYGWGFGAIFDEESTINGLCLFVLFMYLMSGAFRLARFNIQATRPRVLAEGSASVDKKSFVGLPIPVAAALIASIVHFSPRPLISHGDAAATFYGILLLILLAILGILMVSTLRYTSFKSVGTGKLSLYPILLFAALGMLVWLYSTYALLIIAVLYVSHGIVGYAAGFFRFSQKEKPKKIV